MFGQRGADGLPVLGEPADEALQLQDQLGELLVALVDGSEHRVEVVQDPPDDSVAVGERGRQRRGVREQAVDAAALALQGLDDLEGELVDVLGAQRREQRLEAVEQIGQVQRRGRSARAGWFRRA